MNDAWRSFAAHTQEASNEHLGAGEAQDESRIGVDSVLKGESARFNLEYPHTKEQQWFMMVVTPLAQGATIVHTDITKRMRSEEKIRSLDYFDPLTALHNRSMLSDRITQLRAKGGFTLK